MARTSGITWTDATFNPWIGCTRVSDGCKFCYAEREDGRRKWTPAGWGPGKERKRTSTKNWLNPRQWNEEAKEVGKRIRVFCASLADVFDEEVDDSWRDDLFQLVNDTPNLDWLMLTKRPENMIRYMQQFYVPFQNVWMGVSVEDQKTANERIPQLLAVHAVCRWVSYEPALGPVDFSAFMPSAQDERRSFCEIAHATGVRCSKSIDWIICGGESGPKAREFDGAWAIRTIMQCDDAGIACFIKQFGENAYLPSAPGPMKFEGKDRKGGDPTEWPPEYRVQEFPRVVR